MNHNLGERERLVNFKRESKNTIIYPSSPPPVNPSPVSLGSSAFIFRFFSRLFSFFSRFLRLLFSLSVSVALASAACFFRTAILRFLPARTALLLDLSVASVGLGGMFLADFVRLEGESRITRHGKLVPGYF